MTWLWIVLILAALGGLGAFALLIWGLLKAAGQRPPTPGPDRDDGEVK